MHQLYRFVPKIPRLPGLADHQKFQFVAAGRVSATEDCYSIHSFLRTAKLLERVAQRAIWCRSITHTSLVSVVNVCQAGIGTKAEVGQLISIILLPLYLHYSISALELYALFPFQRVSQPNVATKSGYLVFARRWARSISPLFREQARTTALALLPLLDPFRTVCAFLTKRVPYPSPLICPGIQPLA